MNNKIYVLQKVRAGYVGNDILFWRKKGAGYTNDLDDAELFTAGEAISTLRMDAGKFQIWEKSYLESIAKRHVDMQDLRKRKGE